MTWFEAAGRVGLVLARIFLRIRVALFKFYFPSQAERVGIVHCISETENLRRQAKSIDLYVNGVGSSVTKGDLSSTTLYVNANLKHEL